MKHIEKHNMVSGLPDFSKAGFFDLGKVYNVSNFQYLIHFLVGASYLAQHLIALNSARSESNYGASSELRPIGGTYSVWTYPDDDQKRGSHFSCGSGSTATFRSLYFPVSIRIEPCSEPLLIDDCLWGYTTTSNNKTNWVWSSSMNWESLKPSKTCHLWWYQELYWDLRAFRQAGWQGGSVQWEQCSNGSKIQPCECCGVLILLG